MIKIIRNTKKMAIMIFSILFYLSSLSYSIETVNTIVEGTGGSFETGDSATSTANAGEVKELTLSTTISSTKWQAFYGNLSSNILLGEGTDTFIDLGVVGASYFDSIFATSTTSFDFTNMVSANISKIDNLLGFSNPLDSYQLGDIFTTTGTIEGVANVPTTTLNSNFVEGILFDGVDDTLLSSYAFTSVVNPAAVGFKGESHDFEMLVPVAGSTQSYNFYLSIK